MAFLSTLLAAAEFPSGELALYRMIGRTALELGRSSTASSKRPALAVMAGSECAVALLKQLAIHKLTVTDLEQLAHIAKMMGRIDQVKLTSGTLVAPLRARCSDRVAARLDSEQGLLTGAVGSLVNSCPCFRLAEYQR